jgi:hypothetical protein
MPGSAYIFIYSKNKNAQTLSKQRFLYTPQTQYIKIFAKHRFLCIQQTNIPGDMVNIDYPYSTKLNAPKTGLTTIFAYSSDQDACTHSKLIFLLTLQTQNAQTQEKQSF